MIFMYTVTDFKKNALDCIDLLYNHMRKEKNVEFFVISNENAPKKFKYNFIKDKNSTQYVGFSKYSEFVPKNYEKYIYIDSDVLFFCRPTEIISYKNFTVVKEVERCGGSWHLHESCKNDKIKKFPGFNAGLFCYKEIKFLETIRSLYEGRTKNKDYRKLSALEQSSFNYALAMFCEFDAEHLHDISNKVKLYADEKIHSGKTIYHFCGNFFNEMESKYKRMNSFIKNNKIH